MTIKEQIKEIQKKQEEVLKNAKEEVKRLQKEICKIQNECPHPIKWSDKHHTWCTECNKQL